MTSPEFQPTPERIVLKSASDTVQLKQLIPSDAEGYFELIAQDPNHLRQHGDETADKYPSVDTVRDSILHPQNPSKYRFGIWDGEVMVGSDNLTPQDDNMAELGSWIGKNYIGHEYAGRARKLLVEFAFNTLKLDMVYCDIVVGNDPSVRSVEKSGFVLSEVYFDDDNETRIERYVLTNKREEP